MEIKLIEIKKDESTDRNQNQSEPHQESMTRTPEQSLQTSSVQGGFSLFRNLASNIRAGIHLLAFGDGSKTERYKDLQNLDFNQLWSEIFESVPKIKIDMSRINREQKDVNTFRFVQSEVSFGRSMTRGGKGADDEEIKK